MGGGTAPKTKTTVLSIVDLTDFKSFMLHLVVGTGNTKLQSHSEDICSSYLPG